MDIHSLLVTLLVITLSTALSLVGLYIVRKRVGLEDLIKCHEVAGYLLSIIGTLYAVLLGFVVVDSLSKFDRARVLIEEEANGVANVFFLADNFPAKERQQIHVGCLRYIDAVLNDEWETMKDGKPSPKAIAEIRQLWVVISRFEPKTQNNISLWESMLSSMGDIGSSRRLRLITAKYGLSSVMATVLMIGAVITIVFTYFFGLEKFKAQAIMTALVAITLSLNVCLVLLYGYPFQRGIHVEPTALMFDKKIMTLELQRRGEPLE
jgi:cation transporter-like permease